MALPTCPSCGQSVLDDDAVDCPFCGAAMDGSRGARNTPQPQKNPAAHRPGARRQPDPPAVKPSAGGGGAAGGGGSSVSKPSGGTGGKPGGRMVVDEDDPFGIGAGGASQAVAASLKPEKGRLQKVVCPMCEQVGFIPKAALGKSVKCANPKCMVPVFTAEDPTEQKSERRPTRLADEAEAIRRAAEASAPRKRNPLLIYGVAGVVLLGLTAVVLPLLTKKPDDSGLQAPKDLSAFEQLAAEEEAAARAKAEAEAAAAARSAEPGPAVAVEEQLKRMIVLARQELRDKPMARRMTGDLWLRLGNAKEAATELNQLLVVDRSRSFYRVLPQSSQYWRARAAGNAALAKQAFAACEAEISGKTLPRSGRVAVEVCLAFAAMLVQEGRLADAQQLLATRQLDRTIPDNLDSMVSSAWLHVAGQYRDLGLVPPFAAESYLWSDPLHVAVAAQLGLQGSWAEAASWCAVAADARGVSDALVAVADAARARGAGAAAAAALRGAAEAISVPALAVRVQAALAGAAGDAAGVDACVQKLSGEPAAVRLDMPGLNELVQRNPSSAAAALPWAMAAAETARGLILTKRPAEAGPVLQRSAEFLAAAAPPTAALRLLVRRAEQDKAGLKQEVSEAVREKNEQRLDALMRNVEARGRQLAAGAEDRRTVQILLLSRLAFDGGSDVVLAHLQSSADVLSEVQLDATCNLILVAGLLSQGEAADPSKFAMVTAVESLADQQLTPPAGAIAPQAWVLGVTGGVAWQSSRDLRGTAYLNFEGRSEKAVGMRLAMICELTRHLVQSKPALSGLEGILLLQNGLWREEAWQIAGRTMADRGLEQNLLEWVSGKKISSLEQICLLYGLSQGLAVRAAGPPVSR